MTQLTCRRNLLNDAAKVAVLKQKSNRIEIKTMGKRSVNKNPKTGSIVANIRNTKRGVRVRSRQLKAEFMQKKFETPLEHKAETEQDRLLARRRGQSSKQVALSYQAMEKIRLNALSAQRDITAKKKEEDPSPFNPANSELRKAKYQVMGVKNQSSWRPTLASKIAEGRFPRIFDHLGEDALVTSIERQVGYTWVVMTHPDYLKAAREHFSVPA